MDIILITFISGLIIGFILGETVLAFKIRKILKNNVELGERIFPVNSTEPQIYKLFIEVQNDTLYLWDKENNEFVCQAKNINDLAKFALEYRKIQYAAVLHGDDCFMFVNGNVKKKDES